MGPGFLPKGDVGGWAPGITPHPLPDGVGYFLPKGSDIILHVHYHRTGRLEKDRPALGLYFAKKPAKEIMQPLVLAGLLAYIAAGADNHKVRGTVWAAQDCTLYTVTPHMHMIGRKIKVTMTPPGGKAVTLIGIDDWDFKAAAAGAGGRGHDERDVFCVSQRHQRRAGGARLPADRERLHHPAAGAVAEGPVRRGRCRLPSGTAVMPRRTGLL
jgi:hypothetical protein